MHLIDEHLTAWDRALPRLELRVERLTLAKRRWRGVAEDGREFGFVLDRPMVDGEAFFATEAAVYVIAQMAEPVLEIQSSHFGTRSADAARLGWLIGNLHFPLAIDGDTIRVADDPALRQLFEREQIPFTPAIAVFQPLAGGHRH